MTINILNACITWALIQTQHIYQQFHFQELMVVHIQKYIFIAKLLFIEKV